jgi:hypothetical protein
MPGFDGDFADMMSAPGLSPDMGSQQMPSSTMSPLNAGSFQQPFVPQDLWQMPMTFEWDWAEMSAFGQPNYNDFVLSDGINNEAMPQ